MVGNDVVDLADRDSWPETRHARFDERVFAPGERRRLCEAPDADSLRWILWAAKESAYKAARQWRPDTVFSPSRFEVHLDREGRGQVHHDRDRYAVLVERRVDCIHAVCTGPGAAGEPPLVGVERLGEPGRDGRRPAEPGQAARRLALEQIAARLGVPDDSLRLGRRQRVPRVWHRDGRPAGWLSLSHHGRYVAFAHRAPAGSQGLP